MRWVLAVAIVALCAGIARAAAPSVRFVDGRLTVHADAVPLADVLAAVASATGATIRGDVETRDVTTQLDDVPLEQAIGQLVGAQNYTLRFGRGGTLSSITLRGAPTVPAAPVPTGPPPTFLRKAEVTGALAAALGASKVPLVKLFDAAAHQKDPAVRHAAIETVTEAIEGDPAFLAIVVSMDDATLGATLRRHAGDEAPQVAGGISGAARSYELRAKALRVMQQLRESASAQ